MDGRADRVGIQASGSIVRVDVPGCPWSSEAPAAASAPPGQSGPGPPVPVLQGLCLPQTPCTWGWGSGCRMKGLRGPPGPLVLESEGSELQRSQGGPSSPPKGQYPAAHLVAETTAPQEGVGALCPTGGKWCRPVQGRVRPRPGPSQQPVARPVTWAQLFRGKLPGHWRATASPAVRKDWCVGWAGPAGPGRGGSCLRRSEPAQALNSEAVWLGAGVQG